MLAAEKAVASTVVPRELPEHLSLRDRLADARGRSDALFAMVRADSLYERPIPERHRIIFYVGHLEAFDWNLLGSASGFQSHTPEFDKLFAFGIDPVGGGLPNDQPSDWPSLDAVRTYVNDIRASLDHHLETALLEPDAEARDGFPLATLLNVAIEHRLMHVETLAYMLHQLPFDMKLREADPPLLVSPPVIHRSISIPTGAATLGLPLSSGAFGWDNEFEAHEVQVPAFTIDQYKVTNRQFLEFIAAGGYENRAFWTDENWNWKTTQRISHPAFWRRESSGWLSRTMFADLAFDEVPAVLDWPVYVSQAEASAYARWAGKSLPTEAEWQRAAYGTSGGESRPYPWGSSLPGSSLSLGNFDFRHWEPVPVNAFPEGRSAFGVDDMLGNGWEWTSTVFGPFRGFEPFPFYRGYSADFFDGKHFVMKGGSARTAASMLRSSFRNWFQAHYQYVYAGFRCVSRQ
jgi:gamma-glutamyl hercynylcysteine S-oxide synthase